MSWIEYTGPEWRGLHFSDLNVDQAFLLAKSYFDNETWFYFLSEECYTCPYSRKKNILSHKHHVFNVDVSRPLSIRVFDHDVGIYDYGNESSLCNFDLLNLGEFGVYNLTIAKNGVCSFDVDKEPVNIYLPFLLVVLILFAFSLSVKGFSYFYKKFKSISNTNDEENSDNEETQIKTKKRLCSLDTFRGMAIVLMIFVNGGGGHYWWIEHAPWNGLHLADIVFPAFLWIMGVCIPISIKSQLNRGVPKTLILKNILWRSFKLFIIGLCLNSSYGPELGNLRFMGVLQRFGIAYFVCASLHTIFSRPPILLPQGKFYRMFYDIILLKFEWLFAALLVTIYLALIFIVNAPGCPRGYLGPGGKHNMASHPNCTGGIVGFIDKTILSENHIYQHPTAKRIYDASAFDPEGIFGCILTVVQVLIGLQCGITITVFTDWRQRISRWLSWGLILGLIGGILCSFSKENGWIPINKNLWSLSFVCVTSCISFVVLTLCYLIVDIKALWTGSPFREAGMNSIVMYVGHSVLHKMLPWHWRLGDMNTHFMLLLECVWNATVWVGIATLLYKQKIFYNL